MYLPRVLVQAERETGLMEAYQAQRAKVQLGLGLALGSVWGAKLVLSKSIRLSASSSGHDLTL